MKKCISILLLLLMVSCYSDKGNYDYREINELVSVNGLESEYFAMFKSTELTITPTIKFSQDTDDLGAYSYEWKAVPLDSKAGAGTVIGTEKNLTYTVLLDEGEYTLYLKIKDKKDDILWMTQSKLTVSSEVSRGFMLVGDDKDGYATCDMIVMPIDKEDSFIMKDLFAESTLPRMKGGTGIMHTGNGKNQKLWFMTNEGSYYTNPKTFASSANNKLQNILYTSYPMPKTMHPVQIIPRTLEGKTLGSNRFVMCDNGSVFNSSISSVEFYGNPLNRLSTSSLELIKVAPFAFYMEGNSYGISALVLYDIENNRFVGGSTSSGYLKVLIDKPGDQFSWQQPAGTQFIYGENTQRNGLAGNSMAILKSGADYNVFEIMASGTAKKINFFKILPLATDFEQAKHYAFSSTRTVMFYSVGSKLYGYDYNKGVEKCLLIKDFGDEITMVMFDIQSNQKDFNSLYVATYNTSTGGTLQKLVVGNDPNTIDVTFDKKAIWKNLCKIKSMDWRNS